MVRPGYTVTTTRFPIVRKRSKTNPETEQRRNRFPTGSQRPRFGADRLVSF